VRTVEPWQEVLDDGGGLFWAEREDPEEAIREYELQHSLVPGHSPVLRSLYQRRIRTPRRSRRDGAVGDRGGALRAVGPDQLPLAREREHGERDLDAMRLALAPLRILVP
jgi:hypothetical protein